MKKTFYIASIRDQLENVRALAVRLESEGMLSSFPWWEHQQHPNGAEQPAEQEAEFGA